MRPVLSIILSVLHAACGQHSNQNHEPVGDGTKPATTAGFSLVAQSDMFRNPDDDYEKIVFDPELRGKTDRFVMRFRKPE